MRFDNVLVDYYSPLFGLKPFSDTPVFQDDGILDPDLLEKHKFGLMNTYEYLGDYDWTQWNVGVPTGAINNTTVLLATSREADEWLSSLDLPENSAELEPSGTPLSLHLCITLRDRRPRDRHSGLRILNDGNYFTCPGSVYVDGRVAHWEDDPWGDTYTFPLQELRDRPIT